MSSADEQGVAQTGPGSHPAGDGDATDAVPAPRRGFKRDESRLVGEMEGGPPEEVVRAIDGVLASAPGSTFTLTRTFNAERDLEPHLTLTLSGEAAITNRAALGQRLAAALEGKLPP